MPLREGHGTAVEPAVQHLGSAVHLAAAVALPGDGVDVGTVEFDVALHSPEAFEFLFGADDMDLAALVAHPDGQRSAPIAFAGDAPVYDIFEEVAHPARADGGGHPVDGRARSDEFVADGGDLHEPGAARIVKQRGVAAPAEGIAVREHELAEELSFLFQAFDDEFVRVLREHADEVVSRGDELARAVHHLHERQPVALADIAVVLAERGSDVDHARAVGESDIAVSYSAYSYSLPFLTESFLTGSPSNTLATRASAMI